MLMSPPGSAFDAATLAAGSATATPGFPVTVGAVLLVCAAVFVVAFRKQWSVPIMGTVLIALGLRLAVVGLSYGHTPHDVASYFKHAGELVLNGQNPTTKLPQFQWNFLPLMPYVYALQIRTGLPWELGGKIAPVAADVVITYLLSRLAPPSYAKTAALLYAVCPLAIMISAVHGQVEPVPLALGLGALLLARRNASAGSGLLAGLAVATKTWPVLLAFGVLRDTPPRRWWRAALPFGVVLLALLWSVRLFLHDSVHAMVHALASYRSYTGLWGWTGMLGFFHIAGVGYSGSNIDRYQRIGTALLVLALAVVITLFRRADGITLTAAVLLTFLVVTAGFGPQYLLWPAPFVLLLHRRSGMVFVLAASAYAAFDYLIAIPATAHLELFNQMERWFSLPVIASALVAIPWALRRGGVGQEEQQQQQGQDADGRDLDGALTA